MGCCGTKSGTLLVEQPGDPTGQQPADQSVPQLDDIDVEWFRAYLAIQDEDALVFAPESWVLTVRGSVVSAAEVLGPASAPGMFMVKFEDGCVQEVQATTMLRAFSGLPRNEESFNIVESSGDKELWFESSGDEIPEWWLADKQTLESFQIVQWFQRCRASAQDKDALVFAPESWVLTLRGNIVSAAEVLGPVSAPGMFMVRFEDGCVQQVQAVLVLRTTIAFSGLSGHKMLEHTGQLEHRDRTAATTRIWNEWRNATQRQDATVACGGPLDNDLYVWHARIEGPAGTPYENHRFYLDLRYPQRYPWKPPKVRCITPVYHTNVAPPQGDGVIRLDVLGDQWSPAMPFSNLLSSVQVMLSRATGGPSPRMQQFEQDPDHYWQLAREWTEKFAETAGPRGGRTGDVPLSLVYVTSLWSSEQTPFNVSNRTTVVELKEAWERKEGPPPDRIDLSLHGRLLANHAATLFDLGVQQEDTLRISMRISFGSVINQIERAVEIKYDGKVRPIRGIPCVASFPGKYGAGWDKVVAGGSGDSGHLSVACVFLPKLTPKYGRHAIHRSTGRCFCHEMYGEEKEWGCEWVRAWQENVEEAVRWGQRLQVFYFAGMVGQGKVASWEECGHSNLMSERLWAKQGPFLAGLPEAERARLQSLSSAKRFDSSTERGDEERRLFLESLPEAERAHLLVQEGLGWSQKAEVAWLEKRHRETGRAGYLYEEVDVQSFLDSDSLPRAVSI